MSVSGLCEVCQSAEADDRCDRCGTLVCAEHFREGVGICVECAAEVPDGDPGAGSEDHPDVDRYRF